MKKKIDVFGKRLLIVGVCCLLPFVFVMNLCYIIFHEVRQGWRNSGIWRWWTSDTKDVLKIITKWWDE